MAKHFTIRKQEDDYLEFELSNVNTSMANAIRRLVLSEVEVYGIDEKNIQITENTCPLHNEYVSHRISLIPIRQNIKVDFNDLEFYIAKRHTKDIPIENEQLIILEVTTEHVQVFDKKSESWLDPNTIFDGVYLITKLNLKQKILGKFTVSSGVAKDHSRWQCVNTIAYRYKTKADLKSGQEYDKITLDEEHNNWLRRGDSEEPLAFIFYLEPNGKMSGSLIINRALEILKEKCETFVEYINKNRHEIAWHKSNMIEMEYEGEMHTLGNLISTIGLELLGEQDFIGYRIVHPMLNKFILRMKLDNVNDRERHIDSLVGLTTSIIGKIDELMKEWKSISK